jgi:hypothetical protein
MTNRSHDGNAPEPDWCIDADTRHTVRARRNVLLALWAGRLMGKAEDELAAYAREVHAADYEVPGDADVIEKLSADFARAGKTVDATMLQRRLTEFHRQAWRESGATD